MLRCVHTKREKVPKKTSNHTSNTRFVEQTVKHTNNMRSPSSPTLFALEIESSFLLLLVWAEGDEEKDSFVALTRLSRNVLLTRVRGGGGHVKRW